MESDWLDRTGLHKALQFVGHACHAEQAEKMLRESRAAKAAKEYYEKNGTYDNFPTKGE